MGRRGKIWLVAVLLLLLGGFFSIVGLLTGRSRSVTRIVMDRWAETIGSDEEILARYPRRETNAEARELIEATVSFGADVAPRLEGQFPRPDRVMAKRFRQFRAESGGWLKTQLNRADDRLDPPPEDVAGFLVEFREPIDRLEEILLAGERPEWMLDVGSLHNARLPNLRGHVDLNKLLIADSLTALLASDPQRAERALEAAWQLGEMLEDDPTMPVQFVRLTMIRAQAAAVRQLPWLEYWIPRLDGARYRDDVERALLHEGWIWPHYDFTPRPEQSVFTKIQSAVVGPYMQLSTADASERWRRKILALGELEDWCRPELERSGIRLDIPVPWWNRYGSIFMFDIEAIVARLAQTQLQMELSRGLLEIAAKRRATGAWPDLEEGWFQSKHCRSDHWIYENAGDGVSLGLSRRPEPELNPPGPLTWRYSLNATRFEGIDRSPPAPRASP